MYQPYVKYVLIVTLLVSFFAMSGSVKLSPGLFTAIHRPTDMSINTSTIFLLLLYLWPIHSLINHLFLEQQTSMLLKTCVRNTSKRQISTQHWCKGQKWPLEFKNAGKIKNEFTWPVPGQFLGTDFRHSSKNVSSVQTWVINGSLWPCGSLQWDK